MNITMREVKTNEDIGTLCKIAERVWHLTFDELLPEGQVEYMLDRFQSPHAVKDQLENQNYQYYFMLADGEKAGFVGIAPHYQGKDEMYFSKIYILPEYRGSGAARAAFQKAEEVARKEGISKIRLTVNKQNTHAVKVYEHYGFKTVELAKTDIGSGYYMDDFIMVKTLS